MTYNHKPLDSVMNYLNASGDTDLARQVLEAAASGTPVEFHRLAATTKGAQRTQRNLYKMLSFYPELKPLVSIRVADCRLSVRVNFRNETRGRKPKGTGRADR